METFTHLFVYSFLFSLLRTSIAPETITPSQSIRDDGGTLVSSGGSFQLGFFSPGNSKSRYVGIWYMISPEIVVWVANRDAPLNDSSGILTVTGDGVLALRNSTKGIVWSSNTSRTTANPVVQLLDTGNLVVKDRNENFLWQSFDYPCDTHLPEMKLGWDLVTGLDRFLSSWKSMDDPAQGEYLIRIDPRGLPQMVTMKGDSIKARAGSWNGRTFTGSHVLRPNPVYEYEFVWNEKEVYFEYKLLKASVFSRSVVNPSGISQRFNWVDRTHSWELYSTAQAEECDNYAICGAYATCNINKSPVCACLEGFLPKSQTEWDVANWAAGCARRTPLECNDTHGFQKHTRVKLPDTSSSWFNKTLTLKECEGLCLKNCSCTAYAPLDVREGGSGCVLWSGSLVDIKEYPEDGLFRQDLYIKMAISELGTISLLFSSLDVVEFCFSFILNKTQGQLHPLAFNRQKWDYYIYISNAWQRVGLLYVCLR